MKQKQAQNLSLFEVNEAPSAPPKSETCSPASRSSSPTPPASTDPLACPKCGNRSQPAAHPQDHDGKTRYCIFCIIDGEPFYFTPEVKNDDKKGKRDLLGSATRRRRLLSDTKAREECNIDIDRAENDGPRRNGMGGGAAVQLHPFESKGLPSQGKESGTASETDMGAVRLQPESLGCNERDSSIHGLAQEPEDKASNRSVRDQGDLERSSANVSMAQEAVPDNNGSVLEPEQISLLETGEAWQEHWQDMPEFEQQNIESFDSITVHFASEADRKNFLIKMGEEPERRKSIWYPKVEYLNQSLREAPAVKMAAGKYPIYVISKGRWDERLTIKALEKLGLPFHLVVEPQEAENYSRYVDRSKILELPFSNLGQGSIPARNWVWDHAVSSGHKKHWILDDNMDGFYRLNQNLKMKVINENPFIPIENFSDRYCNVALAGMQYEFFACRRSELPPFYLNTRVYSCILINHNLTQRWRGRYNEDTDLSIRVLKDGWCTVLFNAYLCKKMPTMSMKGGNTDELYAGDGRLKMAQALQEQHPDIVKITTKWGRAQHQVDYSQFRKNSLKLIKTNGL